MATTTKKTGSSKKKAVTTVAAPDTLNINDMEVGEIFSEASHYQVMEIDKTTNNVTFMHQETGRTVTLGFGYVQSILKPGDHYFKEVKVGKEDKLWTQKQIDEAVSKGELPADNKVNVGDVRLPGIRSIFENIHSSHVFTVIYDTQPTKRTKKSLDDLRTQQATEVEAKIEKARRSKKSMGSALMEILAEIQDNPITDMEPGHESVLRGYKVQFTSRDGRYDCVNMDIKDGHNIRPVNINTIKELCFEGVKYIVE